MSTELEALALQATALDGDVAAQAPDAVIAAQGEAEALGLADANSQGVGMILGIAVPVLSRLYPRLATVYSDEACAAIAASTGPLLAKYGVNLSEWGGAYKEEIGALIVCGPIAWATVAAIKADVADKPQKATEVPGPPVERVVDRSGLKPGDFGYVEPGA